MASYVFSDTKFSLPTMLLAALCNFIPVLAHLDHAAAFLTSMVGIVAPVLAGFVYHRKIIVNDDTGYFRLQLGPFGWLTEHGPMSELTAEIENVPYGKTSKSKPCRLVITAHGHRFYLKEGTLKEVSDYAHKSVQGKGGIQVQGLAKQTSSRLSLEQKKL